MEYTAIDGDVTNTSIICAVPVMSHFNKYEAAHQWECATCMLYKPASSDHYNLGLYFSLVLSWWTEHRSLLPNIVTILLKMVNGVIVPY